MPVKRPALGQIDWLKLVIGATLLPSWRGAIAIVQPDTILRWHRAGFRLFWRCRSRQRRSLDSTWSTLTMRDPIKESNDWCPPTALSRSSRPNRSE